MYLTVAGEYLFGESAFQSGLFIGLGAYKFEATDFFTGLEISTTTIGVTGGVTGDFDISSNAAIVGELSFHALPSAEAQFFVGGLVGVQFYFK